MDGFDFSALLTAAATALLVLVGGAQLRVSRGQRNQQRLDLGEVYRRRWAECSDSWGKVVFLGRDADEYYQVVSDEQITNLRELVSTASTDRRDLWAVDAVRAVSSVMSELCLRILEGQLHIREVYPIFGTEFLRHSRPLRDLLRAIPINPSYGRIGPSDEERNHDQLRSWMQQWLIYHDGIRRRGLILIDMLWAEAVRLEDLPPDDMRSAAEAKRSTGHLNRQRLRDEFTRLNKSSRAREGKDLVNYLRHSEYKRLFSKIGIDKKRLKKLDEDWTRRLLR